MRNGRNDKRAATLVSKMGHLNAIKRRFTDQPSRMTVPMALVEKRSKRPRMIQSTAFRALVVPSI